MNSGIAEGVSHGLAQGIQLGSSLAQQRTDNARNARLDALREKEMNFEQTRRTNQDNDVHYGRALDIISQDLQAEQGNAAYLGRLQQQNPGLVNDPDYQTKVQESTQRLGAITDARRRVQVKLAGPGALDALNTAQKVQSDLASGKRTYNDLTPDEAYLFHSVSTLHPAEQLTNPDSPLSKNSEAFHQALQSGDHQQAAQLFSDIYPGIKTGIGDIDENGNTIVDKTVGGIYPHPTSPEHGTVGLDVRKVSPTGEEFIDHAPMTNNRTTSLAHPDDKVTNIHLPTAMQYVHDLEGMRQLAQHPEVQQKVADASQDAKTKFDDFMHAYLRSGGNPANMRRQIKTELNGRGDILQTDSEGNIIYHSLAPRSTSHYGLTGFDEDGNPITIAGATTGGAGGKGGAGNKGFEPTVINGKPASFDKTTGKYIVSPDFTEPTTVEKPGTHKDSGLKDDVTTITGPDGKKETATLSKDAQGKIIATPLNLNKATLANMTPEAALAALRKAKDY